MQLVQLRAKFTVAFERHARFMLLKSGMIAFQSLNRVPVAVELESGFHARQQLHASYGIQLSVVLELANAVLLAMHLDLRTLLIVVVGNAKKCRENLKLVIDWLDFERAYLRN